MPFRLRFFLCTALVMTLLWPTSALAQSSPEEISHARMSWAEGKRELVRLEFAKAVPGLEEAYRVLYEPDVAYDLMQAYGGAGRLVEAWEIGKTILKEESKPNQVVGRANVEQALVELEKMIPKIVLHIQGAPIDKLSVTIDDKPLTVEQMQNPYWVDPGKHHVRILAPAPLLPKEWTWEGELATSRIEGLNPKFEVPALPKPPDGSLKRKSEKRTEPVVPSAKPSVAIGGGITIALGLTSAVTMIAAAVEYKEVQKVYHHRGCTTDCDALVAAHGATLTNMMWTWPLAGAVAIATGVSTAYWAGKQNGPEKQPPRVTWGIAPIPGGVVLGGRF